MARLFTDGAEWNDVLASAPLSMSGRSSSKVSISSAVVRSGSFAWLLDAGASVGAGDAPLICPVLLTASASNYIRWYLRIEDASSYPTAGGGVEIGVQTDTAGNGYGLVMDETGRLTHWNTSNGTQIGSWSTVVLAPGQWYRIELRLDTNASRQITQAEVRLATDDGPSTVILALTAVPSLAGNNVSVGQTWGVQISSTAKWRVDDFALNDSTGSSQTSYPGAGKVVMLMPTADSAVGSGWTTSGGASTGLWDNVNNKPPTGIADTTASAGHQIRNASSATASYDATMETFASKGITALDSITLIEPVVAVAAPSATSPKTGTVGVVSNPAITNIAFAANSGDFWSGVVAGTYPTGWKKERGTTTYGPSVAVGTAPVMRVTITGGTTTSIAMVSEMAMIVEYVPVAARRYTRRSNVAVITAASR